MGAIGQDGTGSVENVAGGIKRRTSGNRDCHRVVNHVLTISSGEEFKISAGNLFRHRTT